MLKSQRVKKLWRAMTDLFGSRWMETFGSEPSPLWENQIAELTDAQVKQALKRLLNCANAHPPTLPEFMSVAKSYTAAPVQITADERENFPKDETMASRWFTRRCVALRFIGMAPEAIEVLRTEAIRICQFHLGLVSENDPEATEQRITALLDSLADDLYPIEFATEWMAVNAWKPDQKYKH
jgi:hypothetical protein